MAELRVYADETGIQQNSKHVLVGGFIAPPDEWDNFERDWSAILREYGTDEFHAQLYFSRKLGSRRDPYTGWSRDKFREYLRRLSSIIVGREITPVGVAVNVSDFMRFSEEDRRFLTGALQNTGQKVAGAPSHPYFLSFWLLFTQVVDMSDPETMVQFVFDLNHTYAPLAQETFKLNKDLFSHMPGVSRMQGITFADSVTKPGLQAADLYVYLLGDYLANHGKMKPDRRAALDLLGSKGSRIGIAHETAMHKLLEELFKL